MLLPLLLSRPARAEGLGASVGGGRWRAAAGLLLVLPLGWFAPAAALAAIAAGVGGAWLGQRQVGGYTGDVLGAVEQAAECAALVAGGGWL